MHTHLRWLGVALALLAALFPARAEDAAPVYYAVLGDSVAAGYANGGRSYAGVFADAFEAASGRRVTLIDKSRGGWSSAQLLRALEEDGALRTAVGNAQIVTWNVGGNDLLQARFDYQAGRCGGADNQDCFRAAVAGLRAHWPAILDAVLELRPVERHLLRTMDFYNPLVAPDRASDSWARDGDCRDLDGNGACSDFEVFKFYFDEANAFLAETAAARHVPLARVSLAFNGPGGDEDPRARGLIGPDGFHPNDAGHRLIAERLAALGYAPLWPPGQIPIADGDGDGVPDADDLCPEYAGRPETDGC